MVCEDRPRGSLSALISSASVSMQRSDLFSTLLRQEVADSSVFDHSKTQQSDLRPGGRRREEV